MATKKKPTTAHARRATAPAEKRVYFKQADFPLVSLQQAQGVASAIVDNFGAVEGPPPDIALAMNISPTSSAWQPLAGSAVAYGITEGGVNASVIKLTPLGRRLVAPETEGEDVAARREAVLVPRIMREFFEKYRRAKFPGDVIGQNVLKSIGIPAERAEAALDVLKANGKYAGIIRDTPTGPFVSLDSPMIPAPAATTAIHESFEGVTGVSHDKTAIVAVSTPVVSPMVSKAVDEPRANKVFITHGKQKAIVAQLKELLEYGHFDPVVSVERESTAIPVPEKVFEDMRSCGAGVIHVSAEGKYVDGSGNEHTKINDNVLIEIGGAIALYGKKVILLVEKGVALPSNLQGLYRCEYEGTQLSYDATMKLLKTFSQFR
jgi:predicted nucleotide-binding protein